MPAPDENILERIRTFDRDIRAAMDELFAHAKTMGPALRDAGLNHQADRLEAFCDAATRWLY